MLQITGKVINVFTTPKGVDKDGKEFDERHKVQLLGEIALPDGGSKVGLMDLTVTDLAEWKAVEGMNVTIDVGAFAPAKNTIIYFVLKGAKPQLAAY